MSEKEKDFTRSGQPQLRAREADQRVGDRARSMLSAIVPICGNCRFIRHDEHGGGWNICEVIGEEKSERYKYANNHTCDAQDDCGQRGFKADYWHLDCVIEDLLA